MSDIELIDTPQEEVETCKQFKEHYISYRDYYQKVKMLHVYCPFCKKTNSNATYGTSVTEHSSKGSTQYFVNCSLCEATGPLKESWPQAILNWIETVKGI